MQYDDFMVKLKKILGDDVPDHQIDTNRQGNVTNFTYEKEWKEGGTEPITDKKTGEVTGYKENYKQRKLTAAQCEKLDALAKDVKK